MPISQVDDVKVIPPQPQIPNANFTFGDCVVPKELHSRLGVCSTQCSLVIQYGTKRAIVCDPQHWKNHRQWILDAFHFPLPSTTPIMGQRSFFCSLAHCGDKIQGPKQVSATLLLYSKKYTDEPIAVFCSLDHMLEWSNRNTSEAKISSLLKPMKLRATIQSPDNNNINNNNNDDDDDNKQVVPKKRKIEKKDNDNQDESGDSIPPARSSPRKSTNRYATNAIVVVPPKTEKPVAITKDVLRRKTR